MISRREERRLRRERGMRRGVALLPNLLTTANMFCGFYAILQAFSGKFTFAVWLIILASLFDFLDGRVARMTGTSSDFGIEYDSLADLCTFCMAPALLTYQWGLKHFGNLGVAICFIYFCCGALRLARFNVQAGDIEKTDFQGLPSPAAANTLVSYTLFHKHFFGKPESAPVFLLILTLCIALLMVSNIRYKSAKSVKRRTHFFMLIGAVVLIVLIATQPDITLFSFGMGYICVGLIGWFLSAPFKNKTTLTVDQPKVDSQGI